MNFDLLLLARLYLFAIFVACALCFNVFGGNAGSNMERRISASIKFHILG